MIPSEIVLFRGSISWTGFILLLVFELIWPYRQPSVSKKNRLITNVSLTVINGFILTVLFASATVNTALYVSANHLGLLNMTGLPLWPKAFAAVVVMDLTFYVWHLLNHEVPLFWRFHRVHHSDLNMDVSTATRFHIGELSISAVIKIGVIYFIGADLLSVFIFESLLVLTAQFQHSSLNVPEAFERFFWIFF